MTTIPSSSLNTNVFTPAPSNAPPMIAAKRDAISAAEPRAIEKRVAQLQKDTLQMAQDFLGQFANQLFGDAAKGMQVSLDQIELSSSSEAAMCLSHSQNGVSDTRSAAFSLKDSSSFTGHGTMTTADGRQFEFELTVNYESLQEARYTQQSNISQSTNSNTPKNIAYNGTGDELLSNISAEPVALSFQAKQQGEQDNQSIGGNMILKLLKLAGGDRYYDWFGAQAGKVDQQA
ncbi:hypothetical protein HQ393_11050 [Chitinibacter bivalviorum]|uniref:Uncharacterized protein n=1 Tax=Chitinibacter bivalviorum TaxID=2739434 RepID=A0A7H9BK77_9NEIS|nr:hypothetical protein [Chitinibacter bivalviorum]QLG88726.1 hypothetical protein HQ393_11050 [Chitinibacter bivalviorum]